MWKVYESVNLPNVNVFEEQIDCFREMIAKASPSAEQMRDFDFLATLGELFTLLVYGQLIIEAKKVYKGLYEVSDEMNP